VEGTLLHEEKNDSESLIKSWLKQFVKFGLVGSVTTILGLSSYYVFLEIYNLNIYLVYILVNVFLIYLSYILNAKFTFKKDKNINDAFKFYLVHTLGLMIGLFALSILENI